MPKLVILIKNMTSPECIECVKEIFMRLCIKYISVERGEVLLSENITLLKKTELAEMLLKVNFQLVDYTQHLTLEKIKIYIHAWEDTPREETKMIRAKFLEKKLENSYSNIKRFFRNNEGIPICTYGENYLVNRGKHLLKNTNYTITEISQILNYTRREYFCKQFKTITGMRPSEYRNSQEK